MNHLRDLIETRRTANPDTSYVAKMFAKGERKLAQKVGEEATEVVIASLTESKDDFINESADLLFHLSMLWAEKDIHPDDVMQELEKRMGTSGIDEKAARKVK